MKNLNGKYQIVDNNQVIIFQYLSQHFFDAGGFL